MHTRSLASLKMVGFWSEAAVFRGVLEAGGVVTRGPRVNDHPRGSARVLARGLPVSYTATTQLYTYPYTVTFLLLLLLLLAPTGSLRLSSSTQLHSNRGTKEATASAPCFTSVMKWRSTLLLLRDTQFIGLIIASLLCEYD